MAAVTYDSANSVVNGSSPTIQQSWSHTNAGNLLLVSFSIFKTGSEVVTSVVYAGSAVTKLADTTAGAVYNWYGYILNPAIGSFNVVVDFSGSPTVVVGGSISVFNADRTGTPVLANLTTRSTNASSSNAFEIVTRGGGMIITTATIGGSYVVTSDGANRWAGSDGVNMAAMGNTIDATIGSNTNDWSWGTVDDAVIQSLIVYPATLGIFTNGF